jgi:hypothetical protein
MEQSAMTTLQALEQKLKAHDWYYDYSDDGSVYRRGRDQSDEIHKLSRQLAAAGQEAEVTVLFKKYSPFAAQGQK